MLRACKFLSDCVTTASTTVAIQLPRWRDVSATRCNKVATAAVEAAVKRQEETLIDSFKHIHHGHIRMNLSGGDECEYVRKRRESSEITECAISRSSQQYSCGGDAYEYLSLTDKMLV